LSLRAPEGCVAISLQKGEIAELVPNEVRNLAPGLLRHRLATSLAMTVSISIFGKLAWTEIDKYIKINYPAETDVLRDTEKRYNV